MGPGGGKGIDMEMDLLGRVNGSHEKQKGDRRRKINFFPSKREDIEL